MKLDFSKEDLVGSAVQISDGAWVFGALHHPGLANKNMRVNNRAFAFKLKLNKPLGGFSIGQDVLFIWGLGNEMVIKGVKALEEETGLKAVALMANGGGHHLFLKYWYDNFPDMHIWVCPTKDFFLSIDPRPPQGAGHGWEYLMKCLWAFLLPLSTGITRMTPSFVRHQYFLKDLNLND